MEILKAAASCRAWGGVYVGLSIDTGYIFDMAKSKPQATCNVEAMGEQLGNLRYAKTGMDRLKIAGDMFEGVRAMLVSYLRFEHPDWDEKRIIREAAKRISHGASEAAYMDPNSRWGKGVA